MPILKAEVIGLEQTFLAPQPTSLINESLFQELSAKHLPSKRDFFKPDFDLVKVIPEDLPDNLGYSKNVLANISSFFDDHLLVRKALDNLRIGDVELAVEQLQKVANLRTYEGKIGLLWLINIKLQYVLLDDFPVEIKTLQNDPQLQISSESYYLEAFFYYQQEKWQDLLSLYRSWQQGANYNPYFFKMDYIALQALMQSEQLIAADKLAQDLIAKYFYSYWYPNLLFTAADIKYLLADYAEAYSLYNKVLGALDVPPDLSNSQLILEIWSINIEQLSRRLLWSQYLQGDVTLSESAAEQIKNLLPLLTPAEAAFFQLTLLTSDYDINDIYEQLNLLLTDPLIFNASRMFFAQEPSTRQIYSQLLAADIPVPYNEQAQLYLSWTNLLWFINDGQTKAAQIMLQEMKPNTLGAEFLSAWYYNSALIDLKQDNYQQALLNLQQADYALTDQDFLLANYWALFNLGQYNNIINLVGDPVEMTSSLLYYILACSYGYEGQSMFGWGLLQKQWSINPDKRLLELMFNYAYHFKLYEQAAWLYQEVADWQVDWSEANIDLIFNLLLASDNYSQAQQLLDQQDLTADQQLTGQIALATYNQDYDFALKYSEIWSAGQHSQLANYKFHFLQGLAYYHNLQYVEAKSAFVLAASYSQGRQKDIADYNALQNDKHISGDLFAANARQMLSSDITADISNMLVLELGKFYQEAYNYALAEELYINYLQKEPNNYQFWLARAENARQRGLWGECLQLLNIMPTNDHVQVLKRLVSVKCYLGLRRYNDIQRLEPLPFADMENMAELDLLSKLQLALSDQLDIEHLSPLLSKTYSDQFYYGLLSALFYQLTFEQQNSFSGQLLIEELQASPEILIWMADFWIVKQEYSLAQQALIRGMYSVEADPSASSYLKLLILLEKNNQQEEAQDISAKIDIQHLTVKERRIFDNILDKLN